MAIQIFGKSKCFDTKKAERWFRERNIPVQRVDILSKGLSRGEFDSVAKAVGGVDNLIDTGSKRYCDIKYLLEDAKYGKLCECPELYKTPIVRSGKEAAVGYNPEAWERFAGGEKK